MTDPKQTYSRKVSERLRLERERLGITQEAFSTLAGIGRTTQLMYENNIRHPDTKYFENLLEHRIDVPYILTGKRSQSTFDDAEWLHFKREVLWVAFAAAIRTGQPKVPTASIDATLSAFKAFCTVYSGRNDDAALTELREGMLRIERCVSMVVTTMSSNDQGKNLSNSVEDHGFVIEAYDPTSALPILRINETDCVADSYFMSAQP